MPIIYSLQNLFFSLSIQFRTSKGLLYTHTFLELVLVVEAGRLQHLVNQAREKENAKKERKARRTNMTSSSTSIL